MVINDEFEEFKIWRQERLKRSSIDEAFESLQRIMENPFYRGYDSAFRVMIRCIIELRKEIDKK